MSYLNLSAGNGRTANIRTPMAKALVDYYRCSDSLLDFDLTGPLSADAGYFRFGLDTVCYGRSAAGYRSSDMTALLYGSIRDLQNNGSTVSLPFNPTEVIDNLRYERYAQHHKYSNWSLGKRLARKLYYLARPMLGVAVRKHIQRASASGWQDIAFPHWPVDTTVEQLSEQLLLSSMRAKFIDKVPFVWFWPRGAQSCVLMTHDVESEAGNRFCREMMAIDTGYGIKSSFQIVPEGPYKVSPALLQEIRDREFEINVQDLNHDGRLFQDRQEFLRRAQKINQYGETFEAQGFRAAVLYRNLDWFDALDFSYDLSVPNVAHLDPQKGGCCTVMPYFVGDILEIPLTTTQDYMLFHYLNDYSLDLWKAQTEIILKKNGLISLLVHPDYVIEKRARESYRELLRFLRNLASEQHLWFALPREVDEWWRARSKMQIVNRAGQWGVEGPGSERAVVAFAKIAGDHLEYEVSAPLHIVQEYVGRPPVLKTSELS